MLDILHQVSIFFYFCHFGGIFLPHPATQLASFMFFSLVAFNYRGFPSSAVERERANTFLKLYDFPVWVICFFGGFSFFFSGNPFGCILFSTYTRCFLSLRVKAADALIVKSKRSGKLRKKVSQLFQTNKKHNKFQHNLWKICMR